MLLQLLARECPPTVLPMLRAIELFPGRGWGATKRKQPPVHTRPSNPPAPCRAIQPKNLAIEKPIGCLAANHGKRLVFGRIVAAGWICSIVSSALAGDISFSRDIQPIFAEHCLQCHGPDAEKREADLRLDVAASAHESAISVGDPDHSDLIFRITSDDPELRMPPSGVKSLTSDQVDQIRKWDPGWSRVRPALGVSSDRRERPGSKGERRSPID